MRFDLSEPLPPAALGLAGLVLGTVGMLLFMFPVLAVPIGASGAGLAIAGMFRAAGGRGRGGARRADRFRESIAGLCVSIAAMSVGLAIHFAPVGEARPDVPELWQNPEPPAFVSPPARPG